MPLFSKPWYNCIDEEIVQLSLIDVEQFERLNRRVEEEIFVYFRSQMLTSCWEQSRGSAIPFLHPPFSECSGGDRNIQEVQPLNVPAIPGTFSILGFHCSSGIQNN
jgi:hypothetical protein